MPDPDSLVEDGVRHYGRFSVRPADVNPLDEFSAGARAMRRIRLKEWVGFTLIHPDWYSSLIMQDAHFLASSEIYAYDRGSGRLHQHAASARGGSLAPAADLSGSRCVFQRPGYELDYEFAPRPEAAEPPRRHRVGWISRRPVRHRDSRASCSWTPTVLRRRSRSARGCPAGGCTPTRRSSRWKAFSASATTRSALSAIGT